MVNVAYGRLAFEANLIPHNTGLGRPRLRSQLVWSGAGVEQGVWTELRARFA